MHGRFGSWRPAFTFTISCAAGATSGGRRLSVLPGFEIRARAVVNAAGVWADRLPHSQVRLRLTKGVHLVIERARLPVTEAFVLSERDRILFAIPWGERVILGTTDTDYTGDPSDVHTAPEDIAYILRVVNSAFTDVRPTASDVISTWAGIRPLIASRSENSGALPIYREGTESPSAIRRGLTWRAGN
jgi:glycerol-3-phosphate dehydrogenase